jgi:hypothetical protein
MTADPADPPRAKPHLRDRAHAEQMAAEIVKDHGEGRP